MKLVSCSFILILTITVKSSYQNLREFDRDPWRGLPMLCSSEDPNNVSISCHGVRIIKRVIQQLLERAVNLPSIEITDGIKLVDSIDGPTRRARTLNNPFFGLLEDRELRVKLNKLLPSQFQSSTKNNSDVSARGSGGLGFGGGKKGGNNFLLLAMMMGKMLGVMGFGALGLISMKALMASTMALMLSLIIAAKKFAGSGNSGQSDSGYHVVYAHEGHHEKRSIDNIELSPYRGWINKNHDNIKLINS